MLRVAAGFVFGAMFAGGAFAFWIVHQFRNFWNP